jgi:GNAT superfamily N-acetyltransferase
MIIRVATKKDIDGLARLNSIFNDVDETAEAIWSRLGDPRCAEIPIVAVIDDQVVGFAGLRIVAHIFYEGSHAEITELFVEEKHRRQGIASGLMRYAEEITKDRSANEVVLHTGEDNRTAREFYAAIGYEEWELVLGRTLTNE